MKNYFFLLSLLLFFPGLGHAQKVAGAARQDSLIKITVVQSGRYSHAVYTMDDEPLTNGTIKELLQKYPTSAAELHKFKAQRRLALLLLPVFVAATIVGGTEADKQRDVAGSAFSKAPVPFSICLASLFGSMAVSIANNHFELAIEAYNRAAKAAR